MNVVLLLPAIGMLEKGEKLLFSETSNQYPSAEATFDQENVKVGSGPNPKSLQSLFTNFTEAGAGGIPAGG